MVICVCVGEEEVWASRLEHPLRVQRQRQGVRSAQPEPLLQDRTHPLGRSHLYHRCVRVCVCLKACLGETYSMHYSVVCTISRSSHLSEGRVCKTLCVHVCVIYAVKQKPV